MVPCCSCSGGVAAALSLSCASACSAAGGGVVDPVAQLVSTGCCATSGLSHHQANGSLLLCAIEMQAVQACSTVPSVSGGLGVERAAQISSACSQ